MYPEIPEPTRLLELIERVLENTADAVEYAELSELLDASAAARLVYRNYLLLHGALVWNSAAGERSPAAELEQHVEAEVPAASATQEGQTPIAPVVSPSLWTRGVNYISQPLAFSLLVAAVATVSLLLTTAQIFVPAEMADAPTERDAMHVGRPAPVIARLARQVDCQWNETGTPHQTGDWLRRGERLSLAQGLVEVHYSNGVRVVLEGPIDFTLRSEESGVLQVGRLVARVPSAMRGFAIATPKADVIDLGTEFGLQVSATGDADVHVFEGAVRVETHGRPDEPHLVRGGDGLLVRATEVRRDASRGASFVRHLPDTSSSLAVTKLRLDFSSARPGTLADAQGLGTGLTMRLPGTGHMLPANNPNLRLDLKRGVLEIDTTSSDINGQIELERGNYLGVRLSELGFRGDQDFTVRAVLRNLPESQNCDQYGLFVGTASDSNLRGGFIHLPEPRYCLINNREGRDHDLAIQGLPAAGDDLAMTLRRARGVYTLEIENLTTSARETFVQSAAHLQGATDLFVGLFAANTANQLRKTIIVDEFEVSVIHAASHLEQRK